MTEALTTHTAINQLTIDCDAVRLNLDQIRSHLPSNTRIMAIVKSSGYGIYDTVTLTNFLLDLGVDIFGLAYTHEAIRLREAGIDKELVVLTPLQEDIQDILDYDLQVAVSDIQMIQSLASQAKEPVRVHLHVNTGMNRLGCSCEEALSLAKIISDDKHLTLEGVMTHFCSADDPEQDLLTHQQTTQFEGVLEQMKAHGIEIPWVHVSNSSATIRFRYSRFNMVRTGLAMYGIHLSPFMNDTLPLKCALSLTSQLIAIHRCKKGETVSYGRHHRVKSKHALIGVIPLGYHDGIHRSYSNKGYVYVKGTKAPLVGTICMDQMMVDVSEIPDVSVGDVVEVFGENQSPEEFARYGGTIAHELIACLGPRIQRVFI